MSYESFLSSWLKLVSRRPSPKAPPTADPTTWSLAFRLGVLCVLFPARLWCLSFWPPRRLPFPLVLLRGRNGFELCETVSLGGCSSPGAADGVVQNRVLRLC